ncbi:MAG: TerD family protein [Magnetococcales bacterium]|nr:TerD family protein [Magnetococcales bacterium]
MTTALSQGANAPLLPSVIVVAVGWQPVSASGRELDAAALLLNDVGKVRSDADMIFYNQTQSADGSVVTAAACQGEQRFTIDLARLAHDVARVVLTLTIQDGHPAVSFDQLTRVSVDVHDGSGNHLLHYDAQPQGRLESALILAEIYRRAGNWKFRAVGQGFVGGLAPLARHFGVVVDEPAPVVPPPPTPGPPPAQQSSASRVNLGKITLEKKGQSVRLEKRPAGLGRVGINLNWSRPSSGPVSTTRTSGFLGGLFSGNRAVASHQGIDLDLGCFVELKSGERDAIQALGNRFGSLEQPPYVKLSGDDRTGAIAEGELLLLNGDRWTDIHRILIFAFIYQGVPNWAATDGVVTIDITGEPSLEVRMTDGQDDRRVCAIAQLENIDGGLRVTKLAEYFRDHREMDQAYHWGFRWSAGRKD